MSPLSKLLCLKIPSESMRVQQKETVTVYKIHDICTIAQDGKCPYYTLRNCICDSYLWSKLQPYDSCWIKIFGLSHRQQKDCREDKEGKRGQSNISWQMETRLWWAHNAMICYRIVHFKFILLTNVIPIYLKRKKLRKYLRGFI